MLFRGICAGAALAATFVAAAQAADIQAAKWQPHIDFEGKAGTKRNLGEADVFIPLAQDSTTLLFGNIRTRLDDDGGREGNFGAGVRHMLDQGWNLGAYGYFDRRQSEYGNYFSQTTLGGEALSQDWDLRVNGYLPVGRRSHPVESLNTATLSGTTVIFRGGEERSLGGFDAEAGWRVPLFDADAGRQLRVYGGGYRFAADGVPAVQGPRGRLDLTFDSVPYLWEGSRLSLGAEIQHDDPRGTQGFASVRLRIPLDVFTGDAPRRLTAMEQRMTDPIVRDVDVVAQAGSFGPAETVTSLANGTAFTLLNASSTASLPATVAAAAANTTFVVSGTFNTTALTQLQNGQSMMAGAVVVRSPSGRTATLTTSARISGSDAVQNVIQLAGNNTLSGLTITGTDTGGGVVGVLLNNTAGNINILNNTITVTQAGANGALGIVLGTNSGVVVSGNTITVKSIAGQTATALNVGGSTGVTVAGNTLNVSGGTTNRGVSINGSTVNAGSTGNVLAAGTCNNGGGNSGSAIGFTDGSTCP